MSDVAKIAYLTTPAPGVFLFNFQLEGAEGISRVEISRAHLSNILIDGTALVLREASRPVGNVVKLNPANEAYNVERAD